MTDIEKQHSNACERNKDVILSQLKNWFQDTHQVLEIGSGTGQHGFYFSQALSHLTWQTSDLLENHPSISAWVNDAGSNLLPPLVLDVLKPWPVQADFFDGIFTANTLHIMNDQAVSKMIETVGLTMAPGYFCIYGPFKYQGQFIGESNQHFELWLKQRNRESGIKDFETILGLANNNHLALVEDISMPANNQFLVFKKS